MSQPNFVFILIDDLGWRDLSCYGSTFYETPNLDRLAAQGVRFTNAYASCPVCSPTRASILTGKYPARVGVTQFIQGHAVGRLCDVPYISNLPLSEISLASALKAGGYQTWHIGKWHLGERITWPDRHGFDVNIGGSGWGYPRGGYFSPYGNPTLTDGPKGEYLTDRLTDEAIKLIRNAGGRPFFLNLWHYAVHIPIQSPPDLVAKYERKARDMGLEGKQAIIPGEPMPCLHLQGQRVQRRIFQSDPRYAAMIENLDTNVGRLMAALDEAGIAGNTVVVFVSDNGGLSTSEGSPTCNLPLAEGKGWMYEGGTRVCQIIRWPAKVPAKMAGAVCDVPVTSTDFYPTFLQAAGLPPMPHQHRDGVSLMPLLAGDGRLSRRELFWHYPHYGNQGGTPGCSVISGHWKLIEFFEDGRLELYNMSQDPGEKHNVASLHGELVGALHARLVEWRKEVEALIPRPNPNWRPPPPSADVDDPRV